MENIQEGLIIHIKLCCCLEYTHLKYITRWCCKHSWYQVITKPCLKFCIVFQVMNPILMVFFYNQVLVLNFWGWLCILYRLVRVGYTYSFLPFYYSWSHTLCCFLNQHIYVYSSLSFYYIWSHFLFYFLNQHIIFHHFY